MSSIPRRRVLGRKGLPVAPLLCLWLACPGWLACGADEAAPAAEPPASSSVESPNTSPPQAAPALAPEHPTFAEHVAPIVYAECTPCHHDGGSGPFSFTDYETVRAHATQIAEVTASGFMPPWLPARGDGVFVGARQLTDVQRTTLQRWAAQDAPRGDASAEPKAPTYPDGWRLGEPDLVLDTGEAYTLPADGKDVYRNFVITVPAGPMRFVRAVEILPGDPKVVHHGVLRADTTGSVRRLDAADPAAGFDGMIFAGARMPDGRFVGWTPGKQPDPGSDDQAFALRPGTDLVLQLHLRPSGQPEPIQARVGLYLAKRPPTRRALSLELSSTRIDLPPGSTDVHATDSYRLPVPVAVRSIYPHAHYLGKRVEGWAELPDGTRRQLVTIADWDFDWQDEYRYVRPVALPAGSVLHMDWSFDNSADNPHNPESPPVHVRYGAASTDEMAELIFEVEPADPRQLAALDADYGRKFLSAQIDVVRRRLAQAPDDADAYADLGAFMQLRGDSEDALAAFDGAIARDPDHVRAHTERAIVLAKIDRIDEAVAAARRAVAADPEDARAQLVLANNLRKQGNDDDAIAAYRRALALDDDVANAHNNLGIMLERRGDLAGAREHFARAVELSPAQAVFAKNLARVRGAGP